MRKSLRIRLSYEEFIPEDNPPGRWVTGKTAYAVQKIDLPNDPTFSTTLLKAEARFGLDLALKTLISEMEANA